MAHPVGRLIWFWAASFTLNRIAVAFLFPQTKLSRWERIPTSERMITSPVARYYFPPDFTVIEGEQDPDSSQLNVSHYHLKNVVEESTSVPTTTIERKMNASSSNFDRRATWMKRNVDFDFDINDNTSRQKNSLEVKRKVSSKRSTDGSDGFRSFVKDFRGSRVFVQGIPLGASWQDLKDHFRVAGEVVFASISLDPISGESKGRGIVQFQTTEMALTAVAIMRNYPMDGNTLYVREDVKEQNNNNDNNAKPRDKSSVWRCTDEENAVYLSDSDRTGVESLIRARDDARKRRNFKASDSIREDLKVKFGVHIDDRLKMWWTSTDGKTVPQAIHDINGNGRWNLGGLKPWRQIPTTLENDACVDANLVEGLLRKRDIARREKDFLTADALLEEARNAPDGDLHLRIHDESRTWRIWTSDRPPMPITPHLTPKERCIALAQTHAPEKVEEVKTLLERFPGREYKILKKLRHKFTEE